MRTKAPGYFVATAKRYPRQMWNAPLALFFTGGELVEQLVCIGAGTADENYLFSDAEPETVYIYSAKDSLEYMGIQVYDVERREIIGDLFLSGDDFRRYEHLTPMNRVKRMLDHLEF